MTGHPTPEIVEYVGIIADHRNAPLALYDVLMLREAAGRLAELDAENSSRAERLWRINDALPPCPTCGGSGTLGERDYFADHADPCPDCVKTLGKMSIEWCVAIVNAVFNEDLTDDEMTESWVSAFRYLRAVKA